MGNCCCDCFTSIQTGKTIKEVKKEEIALKVSYKEFEGELVKLEQKKGVFNGAVLLKYAYDISIFDAERKVTYSFTNVELEDLKFLGGAVSFGGRKDN